MFEKDKFLGNQRWPACVQPSRPKLETPVSAERCTLLKGDRRLCRRLSRLVKWELRPLEKGKVVGGVEATSLEDVGCGQKY